MLLRSRRLSWKQISSTPLQSIASWAFWFMVILEPIRFPLGIALPQSQYYCPAKAWKEGLETDIISYNAVGQHGASFSALDTTCLLAYTTISPSLKSLGQVYAADILRQATNDAGKISVAISRVFLTHPQLQQLHMAWTSNKIERVVDVSQPQATKDAGHISWENVTRVIWLSPIWRAGIGIVGAISIPKVTSLFGVPLLVCKISNLHPCRRIKVKDNFMQLIIHHARRCCCGHVSL